MKKFRLLALSAALAIVSPFLLVQPAQAADYDGNCQSGEMCIFYNSAAHGFGSYADFYWPVRSFRTGGQVFLSSGAGQGQLVWNHAAHAWNRHVYDAGVFYNSDWMGPADVVPASSRRDLIATKNDNASFKWFV